MKKLLFIFIFTCTYSAFGQTVTDTIFSKLLNENRGITITLPPSYEKNKSQKYPVLVLLDGDFLLNPFEGALKYGYYWDDLPEIIIVGVNQNEHNERETDCTVDETSGLPENKGEKFFEFIGMEMLPYIEKKYRTVPFRMIAGLDITAGFLNFYLYKEAPIFDAYMCFSPELATGMEENIPERLDNIQKRLFYYISSAKGDPRDSQERIKKLAETVNKLVQPKFSFRYENFDEASHYSLVLYSIPSALYQVFSAYQPISSREYQEKIVKLNEGYVDYLIKKYDFLENTLGIKKPIRLNDFKAIEAAILKNRAYNEFDQLAQLADKNYPKSMLSRYEMALMYEKKGDLKRAIKEYQSAYAMEEIGDLTKKMMLDRADELKGNPKNDNSQENLEETPPAPEAPKEEKKAE